MARPLRIEYPGAAYHVLSRGVGRRDIFHKDGDYQILLVKLAENAEDFRVNVRSYCLMKKPFHLYLNFSVGGLTAGRTVFKKRLAENSKLRQRVSRLKARLAQQRQPIGTIIF